MAGYVSEATRSSVLQTRPLSPHVGIEVIGLDLEKELASDVLATLRELWVEYGVLLFRGAGTSIEAQMRLSRVFGELQPSAHGAKAGVNAPDNPYLLDLNYDPNLENLFNTTVFHVNGRERIGFLGWHWDQSFMPKMVRGGVLRAIRPAEFDGETGFIDAIAAYDRLPVRLRERIEGLEVAYEYTTKMETNRFGFPKDFRVMRRREGVQYASFAPVVHPLVYVQPESGRKVLNLSPMHSKYVIGMDPAESDALLTEVADHLVDERYAYFHSWKTNDLIAWDNWRIIHSAKGVHPSYPRRMQRTTIVGDYGHGRYLDRASAPAVEPARIDD